MESQAVHRLSVRWPFAAVAMISGLLSTTSSWPAPHVRGFARCGGRWGLLARREGHASHRPEAPARTATHRSVAELSGVAGLKLHLYDHCPYCTRVELVLGWRGLSYKKVGYGYADVEGPTALTGKKVLPVLEWTDPDGTQKRMRESVDIIQAVDNMDGLEGRIVRPKTGRKDLKGWQKRLRQVMHALTRPRLIQMPIADFATQADRQYQMDKYIARGFSYEASLERTGELLPQVERLLVDFGSLLVGGGSLNKGGWSWDDLHTLPSLRVLTCVAGLSWPERPLSYVKGAHAAAGVELYFEHAC